VLEKPQPVPGSGLLDTVYETLNALDPRARKVSERRDEMLVLPGKKTSPDRHHQYAGVVQPAPVAIDTARKSPTPKTPVRDAESTKKMAIPLSKPVPARVPPGSGPPDQGIPDTQPSLSIPYVPRRRLVMSTGEGSGRPIPDKDAHHERMGSPQVQPEFPGEGSAPSPRTKADLAMRKEKERHRIEHELQRQRMVVMGGHVHKKETVKSSPHEDTPDFHETYGTVQHRSSPVPDQALTGTSDRGHPGVPEKRTVIVAKKKRKPGEETLATGTETAPAPVRETRVEAPDTPSEYPGEREPEEVMIGLKDTMKRADDTVFAGKGISTRAPPRVRDDVLLHTELKPKKNNAGAPKATHVTSIPELEPLTPRSRVLRKRDKKTEDDQ